MFKQSMSDIPNFDPKVTVVSCFIEYEGTILLLKETDNEVWGVPGGKVEKTDSSELKALIREVQEEIQFTINAPEYIGKWYVRVADAPDYILHIYHIILKDMPEIVLSEEHSDAKWVSLYQFKNFKLLNHAQSLAFDVVYDKST